MLVLGHEVTVRTWQLFLRFDVALGVIPELVFRVGNESTLFASMFPGLSSRCRPVADSWCGGRRQSGWDWSIHWRTDSLTEELTVCWMTAWLTEWWENTVLTFGKFWCFPSRCPESSLSLSSSPRSSVIQIRKSSTWSTSSSLPMPPIARACVSPPDEISRREGKGRVILTHQMQRGTESIWSRLTQWSTIFPLPFLPLKISRRELSSFPSLRVLCLAEVRKDSLCQIRRKNCISRLGSPESLIMRKWITFSNFSPESDWLVFLTQCIVISP